jgi:hypothetical protein
VAAGEELEAVALTDHQRSILALLADQRILRQESYLAGGAALTEATSSPRLSRDIDLFHDTHEAFRETWEDDRRILLASGYTVDTVRHLAVFAQAIVRRGDQSVTVEWAIDSAFRFFPLVVGPESFPTLHPFDLATNKVLALIGRLEPRDWVDVMSCHERIQPLGLLAWAASGKDPGVNPSLILAEAARSSRYTQGELDGLAFAGGPPDAAHLGAKWRAMLSEAREVVEALPAEEVGTCVVDAAGHLVTGTARQLREASDRGALRFHRGSIRGSLPRFVAP